MYRVRMIVVKEVEEVKIEADECSVDSNNNLVFRDKMGVMAMISSNRWLTVKKNG